MSRMKMNHLYIADGFLEDCEDFLNKCSKVSKLSYEKFCDVWKESNFICMFDGLRSGVELAEFTEETLHITKHLMVANINNFERSVASLFMIYAILNLQPFPKFAALRLDQNDVRVIKNIETVARKERRHDILYVLGQVLIRGPCEYHVSARERALEYCFRRYFEGFTLDDPMGIRPKGVITRHNEEVELIKNMKHVEKNYINARNAVTGLSNAEGGLNYTSDKTAMELETSLRKMATGVWMDNKEQNDSTVVPEKPKGRDELVAKLKERAMKATVNPMRHLVAVEDKNKPPSEEPDDNDKTPENDTEQTSPTTRKLPCTIKHVMQYTDKPPDKQIQTPTPSNKDLFLIDTDHNMDIDNSTDDQSSSDKTSCDKHDKPNKSVNENYSYKATNVCDLNTIKEFTEKIAKRKRKSKKSSKNLPNIFDNDDENVDINIEVDKMPIVISTNSKGMPFEIEIIDKFTNKSSDVYTDKESCSEDESPSSKRVGKEKMRKCE